MSRIAIDETGNKYGRLIVIERVSNDSHEKAMWLCHCACGNKAIVLGTSLRSGSTRSCGCIMRERTILLDELGNTYGMLTVLRKKNKSGKVVWECRCACGNLCIARGTALRAGRKTDCGCRNDERRRAGAYKKSIDISGQRFGRLVALHSVGTRHGRGVEWLCKCDCGNEAVKGAGALRSGTVRSCGCLWGDIVKHPKGEATFNVLLHRVQKDAERRGIQWDLTREQVRTVVTQNCRYCGCEPHQVVSSKSSQMNGDFVYNGMDRVDNSRGYTQENVVPCCGTCNYSKRTMSTDEFSAWVSQVYKHFCTQEVKDGGQR